VAVPSDPSYVSAVETPGFVNDAAVSDTILYIADDSTGVIAASVARPLFPYVISTFNSPGIARGVYAVGPYVYLGDSQSFIVLMMTEINAVDEDDLLPTKFDINSVYPNPFNSGSAVTFTLEEQLPILLEVFDLIGHPVASLAKGIFGPGEHTVAWDAGNLPSGVYFVRLSCGRAHKTTKAMLLK
jgi:Secretion system C-terminal sorting domain